MLSLMSGSWRSYVVLSSALAAGTGLIQAQVSSKAQRLAMIAKDPVEGNLHILTRGSDADIVVFQEAGLTPTDMPALLSGLTSVEKTFFNAGFKTFIVNDGKRDLVSASIAFDGFRDIKQSRSEEDKLSPHDALAAAQAEKAKGEGGSPKQLYIYACQVPQSAPEYSAARLLIDANDRFVRSLGMLNDFLTPLHEMCAKVSRGAADPSAIGDIQPGHFVQQDAKLLMDKARDRGYSVTYTLCGNSDSLCGTLTNGDPQAYAKFAFSDAQLAKEFAVLGYATVAFRTADSTPGKTMFFGMKPTRDGWTVMAAPSTSSDRTSSAAIPALNPKFQLTKTYSGQRLSMPYPASWQVAEGADGTTILPASPMNNIKLSDGQDWTLEGTLVYEGIKSIVILKPFLDTVSKGLLKDDPTATRSAPQEATLAGRPAIRIDYTTTSKVDGHHEWGFFLASNGSAGGVFVRMYCPTDKRSSCEPRFDEMLKGAALK